MSPRKLTEPDKQEILQLYRQTGATTSTLATKYGVSSSTISRFLKSNLSESEYEDLIQQKRLARTPNRQKNTEIKSTPPQTEKTEEVQLDQPNFISEPAKSTAPKRRRVTKVSAVTQPQSTNNNLSKSPAPTEAVPSSPNKSSTSKPILNQGEQNRRKTRKRAIIDFVGEKEQTNSELPDPASSEKVSATTTPVEAKSKPKPVVSKLDLDEEATNEIDMIALGEMLGEEIDEDEDEDVEDEDDWEETELTSYPHAKTGEYVNIDIIPLAKANLKQTCYIVVDRASELITRPLKDFADLGTIPQEEVQQKTLPVFDNHRVAKRFAHRRERVIKLPDGRILQKVSAYLEAKGINRLLIDGQIYSLSV